MLKKKANSIFDTNLKKKKIYIILQFYYTIVKI